MTEKTVKVIIDVLFIDKANILEGVHDVGTYHTSVHHCCGLSADSMYKAHVSGCLGYSCFSHFVSINVFRIPFDVLMSYLLMLAIAKPA